jgi:hypothetical protein
VSRALSPAAVVSPPSPAEAPSARRWLGRFSTRALERAGLLVLSLASLTGFLLFPTYPNYDSYYSLLWGRELLGLQHLSFTAYRAPTEHPLAIAFGALLTPLGGGADRIMVACAVIAFVVLVAGVYALGKTAFTPLVGAAAAALLVTRFDYPFLAARAYIDIPYLAVVIWAAVIEARAPRRHAVLVLVLRPGSWPGSTGCGCSRRRPGASASPMPRWPRSRRSSGPRSTSPSPATGSTRSPGPRTSRRSSGATRAAPRCPRRCTRSSSSSRSSRSSSVARSAACWRSC